MLPAFKGMDVLTFAVEIEKNGQRFYAAVAETTGDSGVKDVFLRLAREEEKHVADFEQLFDKVSGHQPQETYSGEYLDYVKALVDHHVFNTKADIPGLVATVKNKTDALDLALKFEKDSILFFAELKQVVAQNHQGIIENLIDQERGHIRLLSGLKNQG